MTQDAAPSHSRPLGRTDLRAFPIAYGLWRFAGTNVSAATDKIQAALDAGITLFDIADVYGYDGKSGFGDAEELLGRVFARTPGLRQRMLLATKGGVDPGMPYNSSERYLIDACEDSLQRLQTDVIDLYQIHRPDLMAHPHEVASALTTLHAQGKIRAVGVSNYTPAQLEALQAHLAMPIATQQPEISPWYLDALFNGVLDQCMRLGITPLAWSPMSAGLLGLPVEQARRETHPPKLVTLLQCLDVLAERHRCDRLAIVLAFLLAHPAGIIPIIGTQKPERLQACTRAASITLSRQEWYEIIQTSQGKPLP
ncbi:MAG TPA: aldo/keto reductase [Haliangium sp.]|nr:aldo/keto reductase [Haliangium sp.]